jgi:hypothetical protein
MAPAVTVEGKGLVNGRGAINGKGMVNGRGAVNGTGIVNGTGMTNGAGMARVRGSRLGTRQSIVRRWQFLAILAAILIVIPVFVFVANPRPNGISIDGRFGDWSKAEMLGMRETATLPEISVQKWSTHTEGESLYLYLSVEGALMSSSNVNSFYLFVDADDSADTGYVVSGIGADYMLEIHGWDGAVNSASVMDYGSTTDQFDWNSWVYVGSIEVTIAAGKLEAKADMPVVLGYEAIYMLLAQTSATDQIYSVSYPSPSEGGLLIVSVEPGTDIAQGFGTIPAGDNVSFARLVLACDGVGGTITRIAPTVVGASLVSTFGSISLSLGDEEIVDVLLDTSHTPSKESVSVQVTESGFSTTFSDIVIVGDEVSAYVTTAPASIVIDGAFGDWLGRLMPDNDSTQVMNPNINVTEVGFANMTTFAAFYVSVEGRMFQGAYAPSVKAKPSGGGGGGGSVTPSRKSGEDLLKVFIDSDLSNATGLGVARSGKTIGADYLIDVRGVNGVIVSKSLEVYNGLGWTPAYGDIIVAKDMQQLELSISSASIGGNTTLACIIETTDWKDRTDWAWVASIPDPWVITGSGITYESDTGAVWNLLATPTLEPGDQIVDIAITTDDKTVVIVTNTGRTFYWILASSTSWTAGQIHPIDIANYSEAVSMNFYSKTGAWLLTKNGDYFWLMDAISPPANKEWTWQATPIIGVTDLTDLVYEGGTMYALRSGPNTRLNYSSNGNSFISVTSPTGSTSNQSEFTFIPGAAGESDDRIFVLCENGNIRYSADGGTTWSAWGNLPTPTGSNTSKYVGIGIDSTGYMWAVTNTGYCYKSTDSTTYASFTCTGQAPTSGIVAIVPLPAVAIPEFQYILVPIIGSVLIMSSRRVRKRC